MKKREYKRDYYRARTLPWIAVGCAAAFGVWLVASGELWKLRPDTRGVIRVVPILGLIAWAAWGVRALRDRRPFLSTDRNGLTAHRQPEGPQTFAWDEIAGVSLDVRMGTANAVLVLTIRERGARARYAVPVGGLDTEPGHIYDHVLKCHTAARPVAEEEAEPDDVPDVPDVPDESAETPVPESRPAGWSSRPKTFLPKPRFPVDPRWVCLVLLVVGTLGIVLMSDPSGVTKEAGSALGVALSTLVFIAGLVVGFLSLPAYGFSARPPAGWPRLVLSSEGITYSAGPDDELEIAWEQVRNVVWVRVTNTANVTATPGVIVYYLTRRGAVRQLALTFEWWQNADGMLEALRDALPKERE